MVISKELEEQKFAMGKANFTKRMKLEGDSVV